MVKEVQIILPVRNHKSFACRQSFLSSGKVVNKHCYRYKQRRVEQGFEDFGTIRRLGEDWQVYDLEKLSDVYNEVPGIRASANIFIKRYQSRKGEVGTKIRCSSHYRFDSGQEFRSLVKNQKREGDQISLSTLPLVNRITEEKTEDVMYLPTINFSENWIALPEVKWFQNVIDGSSTVGILNEDFGKMQLPR
ncbi:hypothetical protein AVEN_94303-1 [Araneus ventricosus]|uniref:Uncharacterized protein n=1 Tax=Araneus ventricosus TaxID=182803 RepID=A0A4Y2U926_ARAVE|nr:hypothetical protein AVEN_94303-1 [Araneus ventricosus]